MSVNIGDDLPSVISSTNFDLYSDHMIARRICSASGLLKQDDKQAVVLQIVTPMIAIAAPPVGVIGSKVVSTAEAWDYSRRATKVLEGLKNRETDREGTPFSPLLLQPSNFSY
jgi:hypothetical protein